jgi:hypothetical protein
MNTVMGLSPKRTLAAAIPKFNCEASRCGDRRSTHLTTTVFPAIRDCRVHLTHLTKVFVYHNDEGLEQENSVKCAALETNMAGVCLEMHCHIHR